jgi:prepilin-type N-terminal cleavage/methylation domain-containing protein
MDLQIYIPGSTGEGIMQKKSVILNHSHINKNHLKKHTRESGFTMVEMLVVVAILGLMSLIMYPNIVNSLEKRDLENSGRDIHATMQRAKFLAVRTKINHRVRFSMESARWQYQIEQEETPSVWTLLPGHVPKFISSKLNVTVSLPDPDLDVVFSALGIVLNYDPQFHSVLLQSDKLAGYNQQDQREVKVFFGGSMQYLKSASF